MTAAIFGLLGVVVGGIINGLIGRWQVRRADSDGLRAASRLIMSELEEGIQYFIVIELGLDSEQDELPTTDRWTEFQTLFARTLSSDEWLAVEAGAQALRSASNLPGDEDQGHRNREVQWSIYRVNGALEALRGRAHPSSRARRWSALLWQSVRQRVASS